MCLLDAASYCERSNDQHHKRATYGDRHRREVRQEQTITI